MILKLIVITSLLYGLAYSSKTTIKEHPHFVTIEKEKEIICVGSLISSNIVVTTASCVKSKKGLAIRAGSSNSCSGMSVTHEAMRVRTHPNFNATTYDYDVAILEISSFFSLKRYRSTQIGVIRLQHVYQTVPDGTELIAIGLFEPNRVCQQVATLQMRKTPLEELKGTSRMHILNYMENTTLAQMNRGSPIEWQEKLVGIYSHMVEVGGKSYAVAVKISHPDIQHFIRVA